MKAVKKFLVHSIIFLALLPIALFCLKYICIFLFNCFLTYVDYIDYFIDSIYVSRGIAALTVVLIIATLFALIVTELEYDHDDHN